MFIYLQEYSLIMSERDTFHKEMEKLQDEVQETRKSKKLQDEDRRKFTCQIEMLKREVSPNKLSPSSFWLFSANYEELDNFVLEIFTFAERFQNEQCALKILNITKIIFKIAV